VYTPPDALRLMVIATSASLPPPGIGTCEISDPPLEADAPSPAVPGDN
jgi:hypothetical protein